jgi:two-component system, chemotaxis family, chemotaxis protein CheY
MSKRPCVLAVDNSAASRREIFDSLSNEGFDVIQAENGREGLEVLSRGEIDIVVSDIDLPQMDGFSFVRHMRGDPRHARLPVLILTHESNRALRTEGKVAGADAWMLKPVDPKRLVEAIRRMSRHAA